MVVGVGCVCLVISQKNHLDMSMLEGQGVRPVIYEPQYLQNLLRRSRN